MRSVKVAIDEKGKRTIEWSGFQGASCQDARKQLNEILASRFGITTNEIDGTFVAKPELETAQTQAKEQRQKESNNG